MKLHQLREDLAKAQEAEAKAKAHRLEIEKQILAAIPVKHQGTVKIAGLTVTFKLNYKTDLKAYEAVSKMLPTSLQCVKMKPVIDRKKYRILSEINPQLAATFVTESPTKPSIKIIKE